MIKVPDCSKCPEICMENASEQFAISAINEVLEAQDRHSDILANADTQGEPSELVLSLGADVVRLATENVHLIRIRKNRLMNDCSGPLVSKRLFRKPVYSCTSSGATV